MPPQLVCPLGQHFPLVQLCPPGQAVLQPPQCWLLVCGSWQVPLQLIWLPVQLSTHWALTQTLPPEQEVPQAPQLLLSAARLRQVPLQHLLAPVQGSPHDPQCVVLSVRLKHPPEQGVCPEGQLSRQFPPEQIFPLAQGTLQLPQLVRSDWVFLQTPLQSLGTGPEGSQRHCRLIQTLPPVHLVPHAPQLLISLVRSAQPPVQAFCPLGQLSRQFPPEQILPESHFLPQEPQLSLSDAKLRQTLLHSLGRRPAGSQTHVRFEQIFPPLHLVPQDPQLLASALRLTHAPLQGLCPVGQLSRH